MFNFTNLKQKGHGDPSRDEDGVVAFDPEAQTFHILGMGYAIGHYARWITKDAVRLEATSGEPLVQVTAFRDDGRKTVVLVLLNNAAGTAQVKVSLKGFGNKGVLKFEGEQSTAHAFWAKLPSFDGDAADRLHINIPARSVTSLSARLDRSEE